MVLAAFIIVGIVIWAINSQNKSATKQDIPNTGPRRVTVDSLTPRHPVNKTSNTITFYGKLKKQIIECAYQETVSPCDVIINIGISTQSISVMENGNLNRFRITRRRFHHDSKFAVLENENTLEIHYLSLHYKNNFLFSTELTDSEDCGHIYFDKKILAQNFRK